ncbi:hypothetical protein SUS17_1862 [Sphingomonas sp. S17]|jgi:hypothetical protein|nr:hypothetical protein SUS17_1862 [Sphingomonas sp. S17]
MVLLRFIVASIDACPFALATNETRALFRSPPGPQISEDIADSS